MTSDDKSDTKCYREVKVDDRTMFECLECGKKCPRKHNVVRHAMTHMLVKPNKCSFDKCNKSFVEKRELKHHEDRCHRQIRSYKCDLCGKLFGCHSNLRNHKWFHSEICRFECGICGKGFKIPFDLRRHEAEVHKGKGKKRKGCDQAVEDWKEQDPEFVNFDTYNLSGGHRKKVGKKLIYSTIL